MVSGDVIYRALRYSIDLECTLGTQYTRYSIDVNYIIIAIVDIIINSTIMFLKYFTILPTQAFPSPISLGHSSR